MSPITINLSEKRANELAALHAILRDPIERQAVATSLNNLVGRNLAQRLMDKADELINEVLVQADD